MKKVISGTSVSQDNGRVFVISGDQYLHFSPEEAEELAKGLRLKAKEARLYAESGIGATKPDAIR